MRKSDYCGTCGALKYQQPNGTTRCHPCVTKWNREYYHKSQRYRRQMREQYYRRTYGVSFEDLNRLLDAQKGRCGICGTYWKDCPAPKASRYEAVFVQHLYVDHDHATGKVRGLLCKLMQYRDRLSQGRRSHHRSREGVHRKVARLMRRLRGA